MSFRKVLVVGLIAALAVYLKRRADAAAAGQPGEPASSPAVGSAAVAPPAQPVTGRWVRLARTTGSDHVNIGGMWVYGTRETGPHIPPVGENAVSPSYDAAAFPAGNLTDGNPDTFVATQNVENAYVELDLGSNQTIYRVKIENRRDCCQERILGTSLIVYDAARREVSRFAIGAVYKDYHIWVSPGEIDPTTSIRS